VLVGALLVLLTALLFAPGFRAPGPEFDEGILVTFPTCVLHGDLPYRDFETFYGPAEPFVAAAVFRVFGASLSAERALGFAFRLMLVVAVYVLLLHWGRGAAFIGGIVAGVVVAADGVMFRSDFAAQALAISALALAQRLVPKGRGSPRGSARAGPASGLRVAAVGVVAGLAGLFRPEIAVMTVLALVPLVLGLSLRSLVFGALGLAVGLSPYVPLALAAGTSRVERNLADAYATGRDRRLPITFHGEAGHLLIGFVVALSLIAIGVAMSLRRRRPSGRLLLSVWLLAALQAEYALWRADAWHVSAAGLLAFAALPAAASELFPGRATVVACAAGVATLLGFLGVPYVRGGLSRNAKLALGRAPSYVVSYGGRDFRLEDPVEARNLQRAINLVARLGSRASTLFVGPTDLRRTNGNDVFVYYLLPHLRPASFYVELDPPASDPSSGLAGDIARADILLLERRWNRDTEPNASRRFGSSRPNAVVRRLFCRRAAFGGYAVLTRCR
jgi:hypothetical protein